MPRLSVGKLMPLILAVGLLFDVASRCLSYDGVSFRAWEVITREPAGAAYLARLEAALRAADVDCVNVTPALEAAARQGLPEHRYVYWRDDTHWNKNGVAIAARILAQHLGGL